VEEVWYSVESRDMSIVIHFLLMSHDREGGWKVRWVRTEDGHHARRTVGNMKSSSTAVVVLQVNIGLLHR